MLKSLAYVIALATLSTVGAQPVPLPTDTLAWEPVGRRIWAESVAFAGDSLAFALASEPSVGSAVYALDLRDPDADWVRAPSTVAPPRGLVVVSPDTLLAGFGSVARSIDRGATWSVRLVGGEAAPFRLPAGPHAGRWVVGEGDCCGAAYSDNTGATWTLVRTDHTLGSPWTPYSFAWLPPSPALPDGRLVGVGVGGNAYSDDGGRTWHPSNLLQDFRYYNTMPHGAAVVPGRAGAPDTVVCVTNDFGVAGGTGQVWATTDGAVWSLRGRVLTVSDPGGTLAATPGGRGRTVLWGVDGRGLSSEGPVWRSVDGGRTWASVGPVWQEWDTRLGEFVVGPDGHLWAATMQGAPSTGILGGVFRTAEPVFPVAAGPHGPSPAMASGVRLEAVRPNPADGTVTVPVEVAAPTVVTVAVHDVLGRRVAVLHDGPLAAGSHFLAFDTRAVASGVYVASARVIGGVARAPSERRFTVFR